MLSSVAAKYAPAIIAATEREYPNGMHHTTTSATDTPTPRAAHPAFFGCYDWHSAVEMHWALAVLARRCPESVDLQAIYQCLDKHLTCETIAVEVDYLRANPSWERPYGWGWALQLAAELTDWAQQDVRAATWAQAIRPLAEHLSAALVGYLELFALPVRAGTHGNSAFAMARARCWARHGDPVLAAAIDGAAQRYYLADADYPVHYEVAGNDFLSPSLTEIELMREVLTPADFSSWLAVFLPDPQVLLTPVAVSSHADGHGTHLNGLNLYRAGMLSTMEPFWGQAATDAAAAHYAAALPQVTGGDWMAEHWLAAFAVLAMTR